ncbi:MAG TPA: metallophosphoesterase family protein, partial [Candidatus Omnitrophota bacterium]|nr:metallophosphoesterase family protein [Candidatus Omnitrophota bacterium]
MRYGLISDVHGNREALQAVLKALVKDSVDQILCAGDIVGYGANPEECLALIRQQAIPCVAGNHDWGVCGLLDLDRFNPWARTAILWTQRHLARADFDFLRALPLTFQDDILAMTHGTFNAPSGFQYLLGSFQAGEAFPYLQRKIGIVGHTHIPGFFVRKGGDVHAGVGPFLQGEEGCEIIINVGSVGQPRDGDPRAAYGIYDSDKNYFEIQREPYDVKSAQ